MNIKGHLTTGAISSVLIGYCAVQYKDSMPFIKPMPYEIVALTCLFFSLFPDLDISSIPQRWFYRCLFIGLIILAFSGYWKLATYIAIVSMLPLLSKHRGWTHHPLTTFTFPLFIVLCYAFVLENYQINWKTSSIIIDVLQKYGWLYIASVFGWWTHLWSDGIQGFQKSKRK